MSSPRTTDRTLRIVLVAIAVLVLAPVLMMLVAFPLVGMGMWSGGMMGGYGGYGSPGIWGFGMLLVWILVLVVGGYLGYRLLSGGGRAGADPALEELRLAYARGDLSDEEYESRRSTLERE